MSVAERWFHPNLTGQGAEKLLDKKGIIGSFLFRPSQSSPNDCTLSFKQPNGVTHTRIKRTEDLQYFIFPNEVFPTLSELVQHYIDHPVQEKGGQVVQLLVPVYREDDITSLWYHGPLQEREAELYLIAKGREGSYLVRDSPDKAGSYVLSIRTQDKVVNVNILFSSLKFTIDTTAHFLSLQELIDYYKKFPLVHREQTLHLTHPFRSTSFSPLHIGARIQELEQYGGDFVEVSDRQPQGNGFQDEFQTLQDQKMTSLYSRKEGAKLENIHKNRHKTNIPYDHTLVTLQEPDAYGSTYINASFISGECPGSERYYIATQGCLETTIDAFWSMMWQERAPIIITLTNVVERGQMKCFQYWPESTALEPECYGKVSVTSLEETTLEHYTLRHFLMSHEDNDNEERHVFHFHYHVWPYYGVPSDPGILLEFLEQVNLKSRELVKESQPSAPLVVQCSDGIGRTGTFIALDVILKLIEYQGWDIDIDVQRTVQLLRGQRLGLVYTEEQYVFIYTSLLHYKDANERRGRYATGSPFARRRRNDSLYGNIKQGVSPLLKSFYRKKSDTSPSPKPSPKLN